MVPNKDSGPEGLGPVAILVILVLGACLSLLVWKTLSRHWEVESERETVSYTSSLGNMLEAEFVRLEGMLRRRAQIWVTPRFSSDPESWRDSVDTLLAENPAILAVLRVDGSSELAGSADGKQILREILTEARRHEVDADGEFVVGPLLAADGRAVFGVQVRASGDGKDTRKVFALFDAQRVVTDLLDQHAVGFAIAGPCSQEANSMSLAGVTSSSHGLPLGTTMASVLRSEGLT